MTDLTKCYALLVLASLTAAQLPAQFDNIKIYSLTGLGVPNQITEGPDGAMWFTTQSPMIGRLTAAGAVNTYYYSDNTGAGGIVTGPDGALWFTIASGAIGRITTSGNTTIYPTPTPASNPAGIAAGSDGALWFTEAAANKIGRITTAGGITEYALPPANNSPMTIAPGSDGALWFTYSYQYAIGRITTSGAVSEYTVPFNVGFPFAITAGPDGALWFTTDLTLGGIGRITTAGEISLYSAPRSEGNYITTGPDGLLWITAWDDFIGRLTTSGVFTLYPVPVEGIPAGIAAGSGNALWFTNQFTTDNKTDIARAAACGLGLSVSYASGTLAMNFDIGVMNPAIWTTWIISGTHETQLWSKPVPAVHPPHSASATRSLAPQGAVGVLSTLSTTGGALICSEVQYVDTGSAGVQ